MHRTRRIPGGNDDGHTSLACLLHPALHEFGTLIATEAAIDYVNLVVDRVFKSPYQAIKSPTFEQLENVYFGGRRKTPDTFLAIPGYDAGAVRAM